MAMLTIILAIGIIVLAVLAQRFLVGIARIVITIGLFVIAAGLIISLLTGYDIIGVGPTMGTVVETVNKTTSSLPGLSP